MGGKTLWATSVCGGSDTSLLCDKRHTREYVVQVRKQKGAVV